MTKTRLLFTASVLILIGFVLLLVGLPDSDALWLAGMGAVVLALFVSLSTHWVGAEDEEEGEQEEEQREPQRPEIHVVPRAHEEKIRIQKKERGEEGKRQDEAEQGEAEREKKREEPRESAPIVVVRRPPAPAAAPEEADEPEAQAPPEEEPDEFEHRARAHEQRAEAHRELAKAHEQLAEAEEERARGAEAEPGEKDQERNKRRSRPDGKEKG